MDSNIFKEVPVMAQDKILGFNTLFNNDKNSKKVKLTIGAYRDEYGKSWILPSVLEASRRLAKNPNHGYNKPLGDREFTELAVELAYKKESNGLLAGVYAQNQIAQAQCLSGAGGLLLAFNILNDFYKPVQNNKVIYVSNPTWGNHKHMAEKQGFAVKKYDYYDLKNRVFTFNKMLTSLRKIPNGSVVLFHPVGHNPTGFDPTPEQWNQILKISQAKKFFNLFDMAYQGFVSGDPDKDAYSVQLFARNKMPMMVIQSFAKNFGLYGQRVGCFSIPNLDQSWVHRMDEYLRVMIRRLYSNNPRYGSDIVKTILRDPMLNLQWREDIKTMSERIKEMRTLFFNALERAGVRGDWSFILKQQGMFAFTPLNVQQVRALRSKFAIYMLESGRMSMSGFNKFNVDYVARAVKEVYN